MDGTQMKLKERIYADLRLSVIGEW